MCSILIGTLNHHQKEIAHFHSRHQLTISVLPDDYCCRGSMSEVTKGVHVSFYSYLEYYNMLHKKPKQSMRFCISCSINKQLHNLAVWTLVNTEYLVSSRDLVIDTVFIEIELSTPFPSPNMLPHRGGGDGPGWNGRCTSGVLSAGRVTQGVKAIPLYQLKYKGNGQSQTSSLGRPMSSANRSCTLLLYRESFAYSNLLCASGFLDLV
ncbi:hypothetical protein AVEN_2114-1 [Araneus ventricosus]|uniref:Uncharacterized protein n=1 Tax=Araneus ventricosus TaxID=182803 RepID=A0A4Y2JSK7_ARAVE|nr:hypothetical protein AVEN_2114-1 [Araneus ventricosus]